MENEINTVIDAIGREFAGKIQKGGRNYIEVSIGAQAARLGYPGLENRFQKTFAIVPLKAPVDGMKVRIDGRTFVNYVESGDGVAVPGHLVRKAGRTYKTFVPLDSMICNFV